METITVYALRFEEGVIYVGFTKDINRRLKEHQRRQSPSTKRFQGSFELIYQKEFTGYGEARRHEKYLKSGGGRKVLKGESQEPPPRVRFPPYQCQTKARTRAG